MVRGDIDRTPAKTALTDGLHMVRSAFSSVVRAATEDAVGPAAPLAVLVAPDDPLRAGLLAAVGRGAIVSERS